MYEDIEFASEDAVLRGRLYRQGQDDTPTVVMAHGTSATITMVADAYAERLHASGLEVLLYDHRNFGRSGGEPRQQINPWVQGRGYRDAVRYLRSRAGESRRIALWGDSYAGMVVLVAGALIPGIDAVVAQIPACGQELPAADPDDHAFAQLEATFESGDVTGRPGQTTGPLPVVSPDPINMPSLLTPVQAFRWFIEYGGRFGSGWENRATRVVPSTPVPFSPLLAAPYLTVPTLMLVGRGDEMVHCNPDVQRAVYDAIAADKAFHEIDGGHFGLLWHPGKLFEDAVRIQADFLRRVLVDS